MSSSRGLGWGADGMAISGAVGRGRCAACPKYGAAGDAAMPRCPRYLPAITRAPPALLRSPRRMSPAADHTARSRRATSALRAGALVVVLSVAAIALAGLGSRWGWWHFRTGFTILRWGSYMALAGALLALAGALTRPSGRGRALALALPLLALALITVSVPWQWRRTARAVPPIHDITTDTEDPPPFVALRDRRTGATNPVEYG